MELRDSFTCEQTLAIGLGLFAAGYVWRRIVDARARREQRETPDQPGGHSSSHVLMIVGAAWFAFGVYQCLF